MTIEVKNQRLQETMNEILGAVTTIKTDKTIKPKEYMDIAKIINTGEKKINREYSKRIQQLKDLQAEVEAITAFADKMGYTIEETETDETEEQTEVGA